MQEQHSASERLKALTDQLEQGVSDIFQSGQYAAYLTAMSKFHHYSFGNAMLIFMQCPNASHVAGYHDWKRKFGRLKINSTVMSYMRRRCSALQK